jgi:serine/threonine protein phosphatase PrpC
MVRESNEDSFLLVDLSSVEQPFDDAADHAVSGRGFLAMVADGMGGAAAGEVASEMAVSQISRWLCERSEVSGGDPDELDKTLAKAIMAGNRAVYERSSDAPKLRGMGTTLTCVWLRGDSAHIGHVGDSRAYLVRNARLQRLTQDQSLREQLIVDGGMAREEAERCANGHIILQAIGVRPEVEPATLNLPLFANDLLLLCSDGLIATVSDAQILAIVGGESDLGRMAERLIVETNEGGGPDNVTVVLVRVLAAGQTAVETDSTTTDPDETLLSPKHDADQAGRS